MLNRGLIPAGLEDGVDVRLIGAVVRFLPAGPYRLRATTKPLQRRVMRIPAEGAVVVGGYISDDAFPLLRGQRRRPRMSRSANSCRDTASADWRLKQSINDASGSLGRKLIDDPSITTRGTVRAWGKP